MDLAILHYHLNRGGVTQVIVNHLAAMAAADDAPRRIALLFGGRKDGWPQERVEQLSGVETVLCPIPELDYDDGEPVEADRLHRRIVETLGEAGFQPDRTLLHVHNHTLGKNLSLVGALRRWADDGLPLLLQIHDFAEDFRPDNYRRLTQGLCGDEPSRLPEMLYPQADHVHYAVLNGRDLGVLRRAGVPADRLHLLPNPVAPFGTLPEKVSARAKLASRLGVAPHARLLLYPVRVIRRKNVGEALLWAALAGDDTCVGVTLPPLNPIERPSYEQFKSLARGLDLPCVFDLGGEGMLSFTENLAASDAIFTTSVAEGFGMVFAESWLAGRYLMGRDLPEITGDFRAAGLQLDGLAPRLAVPLEWIGEARYRQAMTKAFGRALAGYDRPLPSTTQLNDSLDALIVDGTVDFATLGRTLQAEAIERVARDAASAERVRSLNPWFEQTLARGADQQRDVVQHNAAAVSEGYSLAACGQRLAALYRGLAAANRDATVETLAHGEQVLGAFLELSRCHPIRIEQ